MLYRILFMVPSLRNYRPVWIFRRTMLQTVISYYFFLISSMYVSFDTIPFSLLEKVFKSIELKNVKYFSEQVSILFWYRSEKKNRESSQKWLCHLFRIIDSRFSCIFQNFVPMAWLNIFICWILRYECILILQRDWYFCPSDVWNPYFFYVIAYTYVQK